MATPITISAYIAQALALGSTYAQLEASLRYVAFAAAADDIARTNGTASDGTSIQFASIDALMSAIALCRRFAMEDAGPQTLNFEAAPAGSTGSGGGYNS